MKKIILSTLFLCFNWLAHAEGNLQDDLENSYANYTNAVNNHDLLNMEKNMTVHGFIHLKNYITSQKLRYPEDFVIEAAAEMVILKKKRFLVDKENGNIAKSFYYGKSFNYARALLVLTFIKEDNIWKFDHIEEKSSDDIINNIESNNLAFLQTEFPDGNIPAVESEINSVDFNGWFNLQAKGYNVTLKVNGVQQVVGNGNIVNGVIMGGLKKEKNIVEMELTPKNNGDNSGVKLTMRGHINNAERIVFHVYEPNPGEHITKDFEVTQYEEGQ